MERRKVAVSAAVLALVAAVGVGLARLEVPTMSPVHAASSSAPPAAPQSRPVAGVPDFSAIVAQNGPAVVNISTTQQIKTGGYVTPFGNVDPNDPLYEFFRGFRVPVPEGEAMLRGLGSGFIARPDGVILTNAHVVDGASEVVVKLTDKREFRAKVLGSDKQSDIAVLKIDAKNLPTVKLGDPAATHVGEWVLAIGSPFGFTNSATAGIVSAKSRALPDESYVPFIQTDVAVNPGNSGGPLFDIRGEVIGINSQIYSSNGGYEGLSFAIPIDVATKAEGQILRHGKVTRGQLGVAVQDVDQALAASFGLGKPVGALVAAVEDDGPAANAGLQPGDVILAYNGKEIASSSDLPAMVADTKPGTRVDLKVWRKGSTRNVEVTVGELKGANTAARESADREETQLGHLGLAARPLTPEERSQADVRGGLLVLLENAAGPAARSGIQAGDIILSVNGTRVDSVAQLRALVAKANKPLALLVQRDHTEIFIPVEVG